MLRDLRADRFPLIGEKPGVPLGALVAIVENDASMLRGIVRLLSAHGFYTQAFASAEAFLDRKIVNEVACLILDIHLDGISGIELRRQLTKSGSPLPVIFITGTDDEATRKEAIEARCVAYLLKPFSANLLIGAIEEAMRQRMF